MYTPVDNCILSSLLFLEQLTALHSSLYHMSELHFKILVPNVAAGAIIGKKGEAIETIKRQTGAKLKMSRADDFYPGTTERVCLIVGTLEACKQVHDYVMAKISKRPQNIALITPSGVKILVPDGTAGIIIGKCGNFIEKIKDESNAFVQVSQRPKDIRLFERCIVVTGELNERRKAVEMIMHKILEDPDSACYSNCSYSQVKEPVASAFSIGSPFAVCRPPINMNDTNTDSESRSSIRNFPDASLSAVTLENESAITHIDPLLCNQSLSMPLSNIKLDPRFPVIPWVDHSLVFKNTDSLVSLTSCGTVSQPLVVQSHLTDRSESIHPELALNQIFCFGRPTICCPEANTVGDFCGFMSDSQRDDECITALGCHVPYSTYGDNNQPHSRYLSGESVDSAFAESLLSVRLQSSTEDFTNDLFQQQSYNYKNKQTLSQVETVVSPNSVYSISSSPQSCIDSSGHSHHLLINSHEQNCQNSYVLDESNNNFDRLLPNHIQLPELPCLPSEYYGSGVGGVLLVGTIQQLHDTLNFLQWQAKQKVLSNSTSRIMMTSNEIRNICKTSLPPSIFSEQTMTTSLADCNGSAINFPQSTSFSPDVSLKLDTIQPWSIPKHLTPLSLHLPMNQC
ncbi:RNA-binding protein Nova-1 [Schistosoma japonicum]|nr:RNA-binding protein Nova-1 [Schistosoma japonicum]